MTTSLNCSFAKIADEAFEVGEAGFIDGKGPVFVLEVDVEPEDVGGDAVGAQAVGDVAELRRGKVAVAGLLEAEGPEGRQGRGSGEPGPGFDDLFRFRAVEEVVVDGAVEGAEGVLVLVGAAEVEVGPPGVVEKTPRARPASTLRKKGMDPCRWGRWTPASRRRRCSTW